MNNVYDLLFSDLEGTKLYDKFLKKHIQGQTVLEFASGTGDLLNLLDQKYDVLGSDEGLNQYLSSPIRDNAMHNAGVGTMHKMNSVFTGIFLPVMGCNAYTVTEKINLWKAKNLLNQNSALSEECKNTDLFEKVSELKIPVYFCSGKYDYTVNVDLSQEYYEKIKAPKKDFILFEDSAHSPCFEEEDKFIEVLLNISQ